MASCPNDDPVFTSVLRRFLGQWATTPRGRELLFWKVCVPFRLSLYTLVLAGLIPVGLVRMGAAVALVTLIPRVNETRQWWDRRIDAAISAISVVAPASVVPWLLLTSLFFGIAQVRRFC